MSYDLFGTSLNDLERASLVLLDRAIEHYKPAKVYGLFSGGTDSTASTILAAKHPAFSGALHLDTETGVPETQEHAIRVAIERGWDLRIEAPKTTSYEALVLRMGFPGRPQHGAAYAALKDRALCRVTAQKRAGKTVLLVAGARTSESARRMSNARLITEQLGKNRVWINPILHWTKQATQDYATMHDVPKNPVSKVLGMSGECLCGCYARPGERDILKAHYPDVLERIEHLEARVAKTNLWPYWGLQAPTKYLKWPNSPEIDQFMCTDCIARVA